MGSMPSLFFLLPLALCLIVAESLPLPLHPHLIILSQDNSANVTTNNNINATTTAHNNGTISLIEKACGGDSQRRDLCLSLLNSDPESKNADLKGLAFIALKAATKNATDIATQIKALLNDTVVEPTEDDGLSNCDKSYLDVVDQIEDSKTALVSNAYNDVETWMKAAIADIDTCDGGVRGNSGLAQELSRKNRVLRQLCNTALGVVHVLARN